MSAGAGQHLSRILPLLATVGGGVLLLAVGWHHLSFFDLVKAALVPLSEKPVFSAGKDDSPQISMDNDVEQIAKWHLFGQKAVGEPVVEKVIEAPETHLELTLHGIFFIPKDSDGYAIIGAPGKEELQYRIGDKIPGGAVLSAIEDNKIILTRSGRHESLSLLKFSIDLSRTPETSGAKKDPPSSPGSLPRHQRLLEMRQPQGGA